MANCLGATFRPLYTTVKIHVPKTASRVTVWIQVPKAASPRAKYHDWSFTKSRSSARKARQAVAHKAATFLQSRFRSVFDDSPWSLVPHYHRHVDEDEEEEEKEEEEEPLHCRCLFRYRYWYGW